MTPRRAAGAATRAGRAAAALAAALTGALVATSTACGAGSSTGGDGRILVAAAASVGDVAEVVAAEVEASRPDATVEVTTGSTAALAAQLDGGAPFDVLVAADAGTTAALVEAGAAAGPAVVVAGNALVLVVPAGADAAVDGLEDLPALDVVALCAAAAPCGRYAADALAAADVALDEGRVTRATNARAALAAVTEGGADAGLVYATDAATAPARVRAIALAPDVAPEVEVTAVGLTGPGDPQLRDAYLDALLGEPGRRALADAGFDLP